MSVTLHIKSTAQFSQSDIEDALPNCLAVKEWNDAKRLILQFDAAIRRIATELTTKACGGVDTGDNINQETGEPYGPGGHTGWFLASEAKRMRGLLLWALYHHQGGSSEVGQPIRRFLGIGEYDDITPEQVAEAKKAAKDLDNA